MDGSQELNIFFGFAFIITHVVVVIVIDVVVVVVDVVIVVTIETLLCGRTVALRGGKLTLTHLRTWPSRAPLMAFLITNSLCQQFDAIFQLVCFTHLSLRVGLLRIDSCNDGKHGVRT